MIPIVDVAVAFGSGVFAASIGALGAFIMCGVLVVANMPDLAFGLYFGPHVSFAAGVGAAAYAGRKGLIAGNNIAVPLIKFNDSMILLVGGLFGIGGLLVQKSHCYCHTNNRGLIILAIAGRDSYSAVKINGRRIGGHFAAASRAG